MRVVRVVDDDPVRMLAHPDPADGRRDAPAAGRRVVADLLVLILGGSRAAWRNRAIRRWRRASASASNTSTTLGFGVDRVFGQYEGL
jgi:hypothetical protein